MKRYFPTFLVLIFALGIFLRFYQLGSVPAGITSDEADSGYDAYSLLMTGKDQWNNSYPLVSFRGFGDYRAPLYTYLLVPSIKLFDLTPLAVRIPSALAGILTVVFIYLLARKLFGEGTGVVAALLVAVNPWAIGLSRQGIESNVALVIMLAGLYCFLLLNKSRWYLYISLFLLCLSAYTYTSYILFAPLSLLLLGIAFRRQLMRSKKLLLTSVLIFIIGFVPIVLKSSAGTVRFSQIGIGHDITSVGLIQVLNQKIGSCEEVLPNVICRVIDNKVIVFVSTFFQNYLHHFSFDFLYINGTSTQYSLLYERGLFYLYESILLIAGLVALIKRKNGYLIIFLLLLAPIPDALSGGGHHSRASVMLPFIITIEAIGLIAIFKILTKLKNKTIRTLLHVGMFATISFSIIGFAASYFSYFKMYYSSYSQYVYKEWSIYIYLHKKNYPSIYSSTYLNDSPQYIFYLFYNKVDPATYQKKTNVQYKITSNGFIDITKIENINFTDFNFSSTFDGASFRKDSLFLGHPDAFSRQIKPLHRLKDLSGGVVFEAVEYNELVNNGKK